MREGEHAAAGFLFVGVHPFPEVHGIGAAERRGAGHGLDLAGAVGVVAEDDVAMEVVALVERGPLVADEGGEAARLVVVLGGVDGLLPRAAIGAACRGHTSSAFGKLALRKMADDLERGLGALARLDHVIPLAARRVGEDLGLARDEVGEEAHVVRVIRDDEEIERARELRGLAARGHDLLAAREAIGVARSQAAAERAGIHREAGVQVRVAEERARREFAIGVRRIGALLERLSGFVLVERAGVAGGGFLRGEGGE